MQIGNFLYKWFVRRESDPRGGKILTGKSVPVSIKTYPCDMRTWLNSV
jgi:phosphotransacetylase